MPTGGQSSIQLQAKRAEPVQAAFHRYGVSRSTGYERRDKGLFPKFFKIGKRSYVLASEVDQLIDADAAGATEHQVRELVHRMHARRAEIGAALLARVGEGDNR